LIVLVQVGRVLNRSEFENVRADSPPGTGGVAEGRGGRSSPILILWLKLSTSPARQARRPLLFQEGSCERLFSKVPNHRLTECRRGRTAPSRRSQSLCYIVAASHEYPAFHY